MCTRVHVYVCASPPSREHGAVERMRNVGVEEVRERKWGGSREDWSEREDERVREGREGESEGYMGEG